MSAALPAVTEGSFDAAVVGSDRPVLVDFWAPWCGACRLLAPVLRDVAEEISDRIDVVAVDTDENEELAERVGVRGLPTLVLFEGGEERLRLTGAQSKAGLLTQLDPWLAPEAASP